MKPDGDRRKILKILPALALATPVPAKAAAKAVGDRQLASRALEIFARRDSARAVGAAYLDRHPEEASFATLMARLKTDLDLPGWYREGAGASELRRRLHDRSAADYRNDDCLEIGGCYMPVTELRLCALSVIS